MSDRALYVGEAGNVGQLRAGGELEELIPHETIAEVGEDEAWASDYWQPVGADGKPLKRKRRTVPSESAGVDEGAGSPSEQDAATDAAAGGEG